MRADAKIIFAIFARRRFFRVFHVFHFFDKKILAFGGSGEYN